MPLRPAQRATRCLSADARRAAATHAGCYVLLLCRASVCCRRALLRKHGDGDMVLSRFCRAERGCWRMRCFMASDVTARQLRAGRSFMIRHAKRVFRFFIRCLPLSGCYAASAASYAQRFRRHACLRMLRLAPWRDAVTMFIGECRDACCCAR